MNNSNDQVRVSGHSILKEVRGEGNSTRQQIALANDTAAKVKATPDFLPNTPDKTLPR